MVIKYSSGIERDLERFYRILNTIRERVGGERRLSTCNGRMNWPRRGVYFFFEPGENRSSGAGLRVVRVGTHAVSRGSGTTLWTRLRTHRGVLSGGGNHRGSIFRLHVGTALLARGDYPDAVRRSWGRGSSAPKEVRRAEHSLECAVSEYIGKMPFLWLGVDDEPGPESMRKYIERNAVALLSAASRLRIDPPSEGWLGHSCRHEAVRILGLWNVDHVFDDYDPGFLELFEQLAGQK
ncbi:hypothetical protein IT084_13225 [Desulfallas sp. Bu1-1]|uniref:hypothetical protein n=1 Tax=Desulfallas sp. Bu1-1 TaxID=2787620 RepID=UPI00189F7A2D|nr:hypothetical protein [Desulfallas sp. Bu1-1]MBF7083933.1 hypothetical protein [Desulfallas sp. Bu1-1]